MGDLAKTMFKEDKFLSQQAGKEISTHLKNIKILYEFKKYGSGKTHTVYRFAPWVSVTKIAGLRITNIHIDWDRIPDKNAEILLDESKALTSYFIEDKKQHNAKKILQIPSPTMKNRQPTTQKEIMHGLWGDKTLPKKETPEEKRKTFLDMINFSLKNL